VGVARPEPKWVPLRLPEVAPAAASAAVLAVAAGCLPFPPSSSSSFFWFLTLPLLLYFVTGVGAILLLQTKNHRHKKYNGKKKNIKTRKL